MYCTLQEAYQVPSFDSSSRKNRRATCVSSGRNGAGAGMETYEPSKGESAMYRRENFVGQLQKEPTYDNRRNDYKYYCDSYGICPSGMKRDVEPKPVGMVPANTFEGFENPVADFQFQKCGPLQPPIYDIPLSAEAKERYDATFKVALDAPTQQQNVLTPPRKPQVVDMNHVSGYYDEDLESYLLTKEMRSAPMPEAPKPPAPLKADAQALISASAASAASRETFRAPAVSAAPVVVDTWARWIDLLLFFLAGVLIIVLCDQLIKLGMMLGVQQSMDVLLPILKDIDLKLAA